MELITGILIVVVLIPFLTFVIMKVGTYAFYKGRQRFIEETRDGKE